MALVPREQRRRRRPAGDSPGCAARWPGCRWPPCSSRPRRTSASAAGSAPPSTSTRSSPTRSRISRPGGPVLLARMRQLPGFTDVSSDQHDGGLQAQLTYDRARAAALGLTVQQIRHRARDGVRPGPGLGDVPAGEPVLRRGGGRAALDPGAGRPGRHLSPDDAAGRAGPAVSASRRRGSRPPRCRSTTPGCSRRSPCRSTSPRGSRSATRRSGSPSCPPARHAAGDPRLVLGDAAGVPAVARLRAAADRHRADRGSTSCSASSTRA